MRTVGRDEGLGIRIETVAALFNPATLLGTGHLYGDIGPWQRIGNRLAVGSQPGHTSVGFDDQTQMGIPALVLHRDDVVRVWPQRGRLDQRCPDDGVAGRFRNRVQDASLDSHRWPDPPASLGPDPVARRRNPRCASAEVSPFQDTSLP